MNETQEPLTAKDPNRLYTICLVTIIVVCAGMLVALGWVATHG